MESLAVTWGNGSGNGCGGTFNWVNCDKDLEVSTMETWLGQDYINTIMSAHACPCPPLVSGAHDAGATSC